MTLTLGNDVFPHIFRHILLLVWWNQTFSWDKASFLWDKSSCSSLFVEDPGTLTWLFASWLWQWDAFSSRPWTWKVRRGLVGEIGRSRRFLENCRTSLGLGPKTPCCFVTFSWHWADWADWADRQFFNPSAFASSFKVWNGYFHKYQHLCQPNSALFRNYRMVSGHLRRSEVWSTEVTGAAIRCRDWGLNGKWMVPVTMNPPVGQIVFYDPSICPMIDASNTAIRFVMLIPDDCLGAIPDFCCLVGELRSHGWSMLGQGAQLPRQANIGWVV